MRSKTPELEASKSQKSESTKPQSPGAPTTAAALTIAMQDAETYRTHPRKALMKSHACCSGSFAQVVECNSASLSNLAAGRDSEHWSQSDRIIEA